MKVQRHLRPDQQKMLREAVARQRPEHLPLLDEIYLRPLRLEERDSLARAIICEMYQRGDERDDFNDLWNLQVCLRLRCVLDDYHIALLKRIVARVDSSLIAIIDRCDSAYWTDDEREILRKGVFQEWLVRKKQGEVGQKVRTDIGDQLWRLRSHVYSDTTLHPDDLAVLYEIVRKWSPGQLLILETLGEIPLQWKHCSNFYFTITDELQESGDVRSTYTDCVNDLIDYIGCLPRTSTVMEADDVIEIIKCVDEVGISVWIDGGWGVDALLGKETRSHDDLDIVMAAEDLDAARNALHAFDFIVAVDELPTRCVFRDAGDRRIDVHPVTFDSAGGGIQHLPDGGVFRYPPEGLVGRGAIAGRPVRCLTPELQLRCHLSYEPDDDDRHDVRLLCARFGLTLPDAYKNT